MLSLPSILLITNCAATKRGAAGEPVLLRNWSGSVRQRFRWWRDAIEKKAATTTARECYAGDAWSQAVAAEKAISASGQLWVVSAGLGMLSADQPIANYSATFANSQPDTVAVDHNGKAEWWDLLVKWRRAASGIGCVTDLARTNPHSTMIVAVSNSYFSVIKSDLVSARTTLTSPDNLLVISAGTRPFAALGSSHLPINAKFQNLVGGARATLNARMLRHIVEQMTPRIIRAPQIAEYLRCVATNLESPKSYERRPLENEQIAEFIRKQSQAISRYSASALLRTLRDQGFACEQKRFTRIYKTVHPT